jgi:hypothetical protein
MNLALVVQGNKEVTATVPHIFTEVIGRTV